MGKFLFGVFVTLSILGGGAYEYLKHGYMNTRADIVPSQLESRLAMKFLDASVDRRAPKQSSPIEPSAANLIDGIDLYKTKCAYCHGSPTHPEESFGHPFYPPAPNFMHRPPSMSENQNFYIIKHGIRWTGMPAWGSVLNDQQIWKITTFLSHMKNLPPSAQKEWQKQPSPADRSQEKGGLKQGHNLPKP